MRTPTEMSSSAFGRSICAPATPEEGQFEAALRRVEPLGSELILYLGAGSNELICRLPAEVPFADGTLHLTCSVEALRFFDPATERRIG